MIISEYYVCPECDMVINTWGNCGSLLSEDESQYKYG